MYSDPNANPSLSTLFQPIFSEPFGQVYLSNSDDEPFMVEPNQAILESLDISFHDRADHGVFGSLRMAGECPASRCAVSPGPS